MADELGVETRDAERMQALVFEREEEQRVEAENDWFDEGAAQDEMDQIAAENAAAEAQAGTVDEQPAQKGPRISFFEGILMLLLALAVDGLQFVFGLIFIGIVFNGMISIGVWLTFYLWFRAKGISFSKSLSGGAGGGSMMKNPIFAIIVGFGFEFIPFLNAFPAWTLSIITALIFEYSDWVASKISPKMMESLQKMSGAGKKAEGAA